MKNLRLTLDLVPESAWGSNLRKALPKKDWDVLRHACYERAKHQCVICGNKADKLDAHEVWQYDIKAKTQTLVDIIALCATCHLVKHFKHAIAEGKQDIAKKQFYKINKCNVHEFARHYIEAEMLYDQRNKVDKWTIKAPTLDKLGGQGIEIKQKEVIKITNPYSDIDWKKINRVKVALHTHTKNSNCPVAKAAPQTSPEELAKAYDKFGFGGIVITDHDLVSEIPNNPLISVPGNEVSKGDEHILVYGTDNSVAYIAHPSRNNKSSDWWADLISRSPAVKGIEVFNTRRFNRDSSEKLWDEILTKTMPERVVYGIGVDDNHSITSHEPISDLGAGYTTMLFSNENMSSEGLMDALAHGKMCFSTHKFADADPRLTHLAPKINSISINEETATITVQCLYTTKIEWIASGKIVGSVENKLKSFKTKYDVKSLDGDSYIRFKLIGSGGQTLSQPFAIRRF